MLTSGLRIAMLGTRGVPAHYGGFETAVEEVSAGLAARGHEVTVYCRGQREAGTSHRGARRVVLPALRRKALETLSHTGLSAAHVLRRRPDAALVFNAANAPWVRALVLAGVPTALHVDGHDSRRAKWSGSGKRYYVWATGYGLQVATEAVVDSRAVQQELADEFGVRGTFIAYGAKHSGVAPPRAAELLHEHGLSHGGYHLLVARFEPENHVLEAVQAYVRSRAARPLLVVGFAAYPGEYVAAIEQAAQQDSRIRMLGPVWDQDLLDTLYGGAATYLHGHSVGGTNPSLLRAMAQGAPVLAFDCAYNRETTDGHAHFWRTTQDLAGHLATADGAPDRYRATTEPARRRVDEHYTWERVVDAYEALAVRLAGRRRAATPSQVQR